MIKREKNINTSDTGITNYISESVRTRKELADVKVAGSLFKRVNGHTYQQVVSVLVYVSAIKVKPEKVYATVTTFLTEASDLLKIIRVMTREMVSPLRFEKS
ncbi:hypothetical protein [Emticicia fontis]